jgi:hypothetical protein
MIFHCPFCGVKVRPDARECNVCKKAMLRGCPHCAEEIAANAEVCKYCGDEVVPARKAKPAEPAVRSAGESRDIVFIEERRAVCPWEDTSKGLLRRWWGTWAEANFHPSEFFRNLSPDRGHKWPVGFAYGLFAQVFVLAALGVIAASGILSLADVSLAEKLPWLTAGVVIAAIPLSFVAVAVSLYASSLFWHVFLKLLGGKAGFEGTLRVVGYGTSANGWLFLLPFVAPVMKLVLYYHGFRGVHGLSKGKALFAVAFPILLGVGVAAALALSGGGCCPPPPSVPDGSF